MQSYHVEVDDNKTIRWYNNSIEKKLPRVDGPAIEWAAGHKEWHLNGKLHRVDGPAVEYADGTKYWYLNGQCHRVDGPAIESANGNREWFLNGQCHRVDGPAIEDADGYKCWYLNGKELTKSQHQAAVKKQADSYEDKVVEIEGKKYKLISV